MTGTITLQQFWDVLNQHDWFYEFSDDHNVWKRGEGEYAKIMDYASTSREHADLFGQFHAYIHSGKDFNCLQKPKPAYPGDK